MYLRCARSSTKIFTFARKQAICCLKYIEVTTALDTSYEGHVGREAHCESREKLVSLWAVCRSAGSGGVGSEDRQSCYGSA